MTKLTEKQLAFVANKAAGVNNRDAAIAAGYAEGSADVAAHRLMHKPAIKAAIKTATKGVSPVHAKCGVPTMPRNTYADAMTFLQDVMNHSQLPIAMRADAAKQLLPYQHGRVGETGKKQAAKERASEIAGGKRGPFTPKQPPQLRAITGGKSDAN